jgi:hypothetical protein
VESYPLPIRIVEGLQLDDIRMSDDAHDLELSILYQLSAEEVELTCDEAHLESFVLQHSLDGSIFSARRQLGLEHHAKRPIADYLALCVLHLSCLASEAILDLLPNYLCTQNSQRTCSKTTIKVVDIFNTSENTYRPCASLRILHRAYFATSSRARVFWDPPWRPLLLRETERQQECPMKAVGSVGGGENEVEKGVTDSNFARDVSRTRLRLRSRDGEEET